MRKILEKQTLLYPMPVLIIGTYDENGKADAMNAAWGGIKDTNQIYICLSHVGLMIKSTASLIGLLTLLITVLLPVLASQNIESNEFVTGMISYLFIVAMVIISILYKMNMEKKNKMKEFSILNKVGYVYSDLKKMLLKENILYFICVLVIPLPYLIFMAREFILMNSTMLFFYSGLFIYYVVTLLICLLLNYHAGKIQLLKGE